MESDAIIGTSHSRRSVCSESEQLSIHATSSYSSMTCKAPLMSLTKRTHDEISALSDSHISESGSQSCQVRRPRLLLTEPTMNEGGLFAWARRSIHRGIVSIFGWQSTSVGRERSSNALRRQGSIRDVTYMLITDYWVVTEEQERHSAVIIHANSHIDRVSPTGTEQPNINTPRGDGILRHDDLSTKKFQMPVPQQLPSPLASEDETSVPRVLLLKRSLSKKCQQNTRPTNDGILQLEQPQKPFYPKSFSSKSSQQLFLESRLRRDKQHERKTNASIPTLPFHLRGVTCQQRRTLRGFQTLHGSIRRPAMGVSQSRRSAPEAAPSSMSRRSGRITSRMSKPGLKKCSLVHAIERAKASGAAEDEHLRAVLRQLQVDSQGRFLSWHEDQSRRRRIDAEVKRLKEQGQQERIHSLNLEESQEWQKYYNEVKVDYRRHPSKLYISKKFGKETLEIRTEDLATLLGVDLHGGWLNDNIILFYLGLIGERENKERLRVILHNTFFYPKFLKDDFKGVARWTAKKGVSGLKILDLDYIVVPICQNHHWTVGVINCKNKRFEYYDSIALRPPQCHYQNLRRYVIGETSGMVELNEWTDYWQPNAPKQQNGRDCGVFAIKTAEVVARGKKPCWNGAEVEIGNLRKRMLLEIVHGRLMPIDD
ncbi:cysteine proteinase [Wilcoxina mikolae CBS 423.85]|nr:cysteine proteinase [Wilcoxina mikolae CBS 423.85]